MNILSSRDKRSFAPSKFPPSRSSSTNRRRIVNGCCILIVILIGTLIALSIGFYLAIYAMQMVISKPSKLFLTSASSFANRNDNKDNVDHSASNLDNSLTNEQLQFRTMIRNLPKDIVQQVSRQSRPALSCPPSRTDEVVSLDLFTLFPSSSSLSSNQSTGTRTIGTKNHQSYLFSSLRTFPWYIQERIGLYFNNLFPEILHQQLYNKYRCYFGVDEKDDDVTLLPSSLWKRHGSPRAIFLIGSTVRSWSSSDRLMHTDRLADQITSLFVTFELMGWETKILSLSRENLLQQYTIQRYIQWLFEADSIFIDIDGLQEYFDITCVSVLDTAFSTQTYPFILQQYPSLLSRLYILMENGKYIKSLTNIKNCLENLGFEEKHLLNGLYRDTAGPSGFPLGYTVPPLQQLTYVGDENGITKTSKETRDSSSVSSGIIQQPSRINGVYLHIHTVDELRNPSVEKLIRFLQENNYEVHVGIATDSPPSTKEENEEGNDTHDTTKPNTELPEQIINHGQLSTDGLRMVLRLLKIFIDFGGEWIPEPTNIVKNTDPTYDPNDGSIVDTMTQEDMDIFHAAAAGCTILLHQPESIRTDVPVQSTTSTGSWLRQEMTKTKNHNFPLYPLDLSKEAELLPLLRTIENQVSSESFVPYILPVMRTSSYVQRIEELIRNVLNE